ncbi:5'/3'-nucleotidase SurE [Candidatus Steffania adelgidicola]|nr:5'/3'-nucleotidase SurE [Candidatus Steffania adelgidicola]
MCSGIQQLAVALHHFNTVQIITSELIAAVHRMPSHWTHCYVCKLDLDGNITIFSNTFTDYMYLGMNALICHESNMSLSSINVGQNVDNDASYSITMAAGIKKRYLSHLALAISLHGYHHFETIIFITYRVLFTLTNILPNVSKVLNFNILDLPLSSIKSFKITLCGNQYYVRKVIRKPDPSSRAILWVGPQGSSCKSGVHNDFDAISQQECIAFTSPHLNLTTNATLPILNEWLNHTEGPTPWC